MAYRVFYWFDVLYFILVHWKDLPERDVARIAELAAQTNQTVLEARGIHTYCWWCTAKERIPSVEIQQKGRELAIRAYRLWRACGRMDRADEAINWSAYLLKGRYNRRVAARYARRLSRTTPVVGADQIRLVKSEGMRWWLGATETQRVEWLSRMLLRYLDVSNGSAPSISQMSRAGHWVQDILAVGVLGKERRRLIGISNPPEGHILDGPAWHVLRGQLPFSFPQITAREMIKDCLQKLNLELDIN